MGESAGHEDLVDLIYQAALDADLWSEVLDRLVDLIDGEAATLHWYDLFTGRSSGVGARVDQLALDQAFSDFGRCNPLTEKDPLRKRQRLRNYKPRIRRDVDWLPKEDFVKTEYYNDFFQAFGFHSDITLGLMVEEVGAGQFEGAGLNIFRHKRRGDWAEDDMALCAWLHPHLIRSFRLGRQIAATQEVGKSLIEFLERAPWGVFLLDAQGRVNHVNAAGSALLAEDGGLALVSRRLSAHRSADTRRLHQLVAEAASADCERRTGGSMSLATLTRRRPLSVVVAPVGGDRASFLPGPTAAIVCVTDLDATTTLPEKELRDLFGLTTAEARVALAVSEDLDPSAVANRLGVALPTVRTHLSRIFEKTETTGQAGLSRLLMRVAAGPKAGD